MVLYRTPLNLFFSKIAQNNRKITVIKQLPISTTFLLGIVTTIPIILYLCFSYVSAVPQRQQLLQPNDQL